MNSMHVQCAEVLRSAAGAARTAAERLRARAAFQRGERDAAVALLEALLATDAADWQARADLLQCLRRSGRLDAAQAHLDAASATDAAAGASAAGFHFCRCACRPPSPQRAAICCALRSPPASSRCADDLVCLNPGLEPRPYAAAAWPGLLQMCRMA